MSGRVVLTGPLLCALLGAVLGCGEPQQVERQIQRPPLSLLRAQGTQPAHRTVEPRFREFDELAAGIAPERQILAPRQEDVGPRTEAFFFPEHENNNLPKRATKVSLPAILSGYMDPLIDVPAGDEDWYTFLVERDHPGVMDIELAGVTKLDLALEIHFDAFRGRELLVKVNNQGRGQGERLPNFSLPNGRYYVRVVQEVTDERPARFDVVNPYRVTLTPKEISATEETEPNDRALSAVPLRLDEQMTGLINRVADDDWYSVELTSVSAFSRMSVELLPPMDTALELAVFTQARQELMVVQTADGKRLLLPNIAVLEGSGGYLLRVQSTGSKLPRDPYRLLVSTAALEERMELEPNDQAEAALRLYWEEPMTGYLSHDGDVDWYKLEPNHEWGLAEDGQAVKPALNLVLSGVPGLDVTLELFDSDRESPLAKYNAGSNGDGEEAPNLAVPQRTTYLKIAAVAGSNAGAAYILQARAIPTTGMEAEPNNTPDHPTVIDAMGDKVLGYLSPAGDRDCLRFLEADLALQFKAPPDANVKISGYDANGLLFFQRETDGSQRIPGSNGPLTVCLELAGDGATAPGKPYILVPVADLPEP